MGSKLWARPFMALLCFTVSFGCGSPSPKPLPTEETPKSLVEAGEFAEAEKILKPLAWERRSASDGPELLLLLARCEEGLGKHTEAERTLYRCLTATGRSREQTVAAHTGLSRMARADGRLFSADLHLTKALDAGSTDRMRDTVRMLMIESALDQGKVGDARSIFLKISNKEMTGLSAISKRLGLSDQPKLPKVTQPVVARGPHILSRREWRARPVNFRGNPTGLGRPYRITIHHGAEAVAAPTSMSGAAQRVRSYQSAHQVSNGWADIGYHFVIDASGRIWQGRELKWQGAHAGSPAANKGNIGVCLMGDFEKVAPNYAQKKGLERLLDHLTSRYKISWSRVEGHNSVLKHHHQNRGTRCPGRHLQGWLDRLKRQHIS